MIEIEQVKAIRDGGAHFFGGRRFSLETADGRTLRVRRVGYRDPSVIDVGDWMTPEWSGRCEELLRALRDRGVPVLCGGTGAEPYPYPGDYYGGLG